MSPHRIARRVEELRRGLAQLSGLADSPGNGQGNGVAAEERLTHRLLELFLRRELFNLENAAAPGDTTPCRQVGYLNVGGYVKRDYAPLVERLRRATQAMAQVPDFLQVIDAALTAELSRPVLEMSIESYRGMARFYRVDLRVDPGQSNNGVGDADTLAPLRPGQRTGGPGFGRVRRQAGRAVGPGCQRATTATLPSAPSCTPICWPTAKGST